MSGILSFVVGLTLPRILPAADEVESEDEDDDEDVGIELTPVADHAESFAAPAWHNLGLEHLSIF